MSRALRLDMHVHTRFSHDGLEAPARLVERAVEIGLDGLAITDHNTQEGIPEAMEAGEQLGIAVIPGVELSCVEGHVLAYGSESFGIGRGCRVGEVLSIIRSDFPECIVAPAHPFDFYRGGMGWAAARYRFDAVETVNAHSVVPRPVVLSMAKKMGVAEIGGSDAHALRGLGSGLTLVPADDPPILHRIARAGRATGWFHPIGMVMERLAKAKRRQEHAP